MWVQAIGEGTLQNEWETAVNETESFMSNVFAGAVRADAIIPTTGIWGSYFTGIGPSLTFDDGLVQRIYIGLTGGLVRVEADSLFGFGNGFGDSIDRLRELGPQ